jgi:hypothetical protein
MPHGRSCTNVACADLECLGDVGVAGVRISQREVSRTLEENSVASSKATDTRLRSEVSCRSRMSRPSVVIARP